MDNEKFSKLMYFLTKHAARDGFIDFLEGIGLKWEDYEQIRDHLKEVYNVKTYV
jgi:hypothetical protein